MLNILDGLLFITHLVVILFNLTGWIWQRTRRMHLLVLALTLFSWLVLGFWYGFGYCFLTDWEWDVKRQLGETELPNSFIQYLTNNVLGLNLSSNLVDAFTGGSFLAAIGMSLWVNLKKDKKKPSSNK